MPLAPMRPCSVHGCRNVTRTGRCKQHGGASPAHRWDTDRDSHAGRLSGRRLQAARLALFRVEPLCRPCSAAGRVTVATIRDHIVPLAEGGTDAPSNLQPICAECHAVKVVEESRRAKARQR